MSIGFEWRDGQIREVIVYCRAPVVETVVFCVTEEAENSFNGDVVDPSRFSIVLGEFYDGIEDIGTASYGGKE